LSEKSPQIQECPSDATIVPQEDSIILYHGTRTPPEVVAKQGIIPWPSGEIVGGQPVVFLTPLIDLASLYGKYIYIIEKWVGNPMAKRVQELLQQVEEGIETTDRDWDIVEMVFDEIEPTDIKCWQRRDK